MSTSFKDILKKKRAAENGQPQWLRDWKAGQRIMELPRRLASDVTETAQDLRDEPEEVPYRINERVRSYFSPFRRRKP